MFGRLLSELSGLIKVALEVATELAARQESSLEPVELIEDSPEGHGHAFLDLLADALNHALSVNHLSHQSLQQHASLSGHSVVAVALPTLHIVP